MTFSDDVPTAGEEVSGRHRAVKAERRSGRESQVHDAEQLLRRAADLIASARAMPLSTSVMINKEEVLDLVGEALDRLPQELKEARWLLKECDEVRSNAHAEANEIEEAARAKAERMVQRTEVVKASELRARHVLESAEADSRRLRHECEDFCDQKLASFEIVLERTQRIVAAGREKLQALPLSISGPEEEADEDEQAFFDQDQE